MGDVSFDEIIQEGRRKKAAEKLAQEIFGKGRRSSAPPSGPKVGLGGSLASRVGVNKPRTPSVPRSPTPRQNRPSGPTRPPPNSRPSYTKPLADRANDAKSNGYATDETANAGSGVNIKGAASGPYIVIAQNFQPGTTAADIESVMQDVGGQMMSCKLKASDPTVIAEMAFVEKSGAEKVIDTFNGKKADGRVLYVYWRSGGGGLNRGSSPGRQQPPRPEPQTSFGAAQSEDVAMEVDENAEAREAENRRREEHRGRDDRAQREVFPTGPRGQYRSENESYYDQRPRQNYQDGRYGFGGGYRDEGRPRYGQYGEDRRRGRGGQSWRP